MKTNRRTSRRFVPGNGMGGVGGQLLEILEAKQLLSTLVTDPSLTDTEKGSLRWAIATTPAGGTIDIKVRELVGNRGNPIVIHTNDLTIQGEESGATWLGGTLFENLAKGTKIDNLSMSLAGPAGTPGIVNYGTLTLNTNKYRGHGLENLSGTVALVGCEVVTAGVAFSNTGTMSLLGCRTNGDGFSNSGTLSVTTSTVDVTDGDGVDSSKGTVTITGSTLTVTSGVGINSTGTVTVTGSTLNVANGTGISSVGTATITGSTFNVANGDVDSTGSLNVSSSMLNILNGQFSSNGALNISSSSVDLPNGNFYAEGGTVTLDRTYVYVGATGGGPYYGVVITLQPGFNFSMLDASQIQQGSLPVTSGGGGTILTESIGIQSVMTPALTVNEIGGTPSYFDQSNVTIDVSAINAYVTDNALTFNGVWNVNITFSTINGNISGSALNNFNCC